MIGLILIILYGFGILWAIVTFQLTLGISILLLISLILFAVVWFLTYAL